MAPRAQLSKVETGTNFDGSGVPDDAHSYLRKVYNDPLQPDHVRIRAAQIAIEFERPKLGVNVNMNLGEDFAARLDRAIERTNGVKVIEHVGGEGSKTQTQSEAQVVSREHLARPILPKLTRRI